MMAKTTLRRTPLLVLAVLLTAALLPGAASAQCIDPGSVVGACDADGDGCIKNSGGCVRKNPGAEIDCNDGSFDPTNQCGGSPPLQQRFVGELTEGTFLFADGAVSFLLEPPSGTGTSNLAYSEQTVVYERSVDPSGWDAIFGACPELFAPPEFLVADVGGVSVQKAANVMQLNSVAQGVEGVSGDPIELRFVLEGLTDGSVPLGTSGVEYRFETVNVIARSLTKRRRSCKTGKTPLVPESALVTSAPIVP